MLRSEKMRSNKTTNMSEKSLSENAAESAEKLEMKWINVICIGTLHLLTLYGLLMFPYIQSFPTVVFQIIHGSLSGFGVTAAAHRLWSHRAFKAKLPLRMLLIACYTMAGQNTLYDWVRDHRVHHKFSETSADPHDANRGFFFSHVGWLMCKKRPEVLRKGKLVDMSDVLEDPVVQFHQRYFTITKLLLAFLLPVAIPCHFWNESLYNSSMSCLVRYCVVLNFTWCVNSVAHLFGTRPYNKEIGARENTFVSMVAMGEGWHNYHHTFPWDYKAGEFGKWNVTTFWINLFAKMGLAYDLRTPTIKLVENVVENKGDGTYKRRS